MAVEVGWGGDPSFTVRGHWSRSSGSGARRFGGHSLRVTGARTLAALGIDIVLIQLMARWSSDVVLRYVAEAPLATMSAAYRAGYAAKASDPASPRTQPHSLCGDVRSLTAQVRHASVRQ